MSSRRRTIVVSIAGLVAVLLYCALAALQILVLNPLAAAPGLSLDEIRTIVGVGLEPDFVVIILGLGVALAVALAAVAIGASLPPRLTATLFLVLLAFGAFAYFGASFGPGMSLADTFGIGGADHSPWAMPLYLVSAASAIAATVMAVSASRSNSRSDAASSHSGIRSTT